VARCLSKILALNKFLNKIRIAMVKGLGLDEAGKKYLPGRKTGQMLLNDH
jgi:hypothetical protein